MIKRKVRPIAFNLTGIIDDSSVSLVETHPTGQNSIPADVRNTLKRKLDVALVTLSQCFDEGVIRGGVKSYDFDLKIYPRGEGKY